MSDIPTKTYPPSFLRALIADHEAERAGATPEESSAIETKGDSMSNIARFQILNDEWVRYDDHRAEVERLTGERDAALAEVERLRGETQRAVEAEREACASLFDGPVWAYDYREIAARIRARRGGRDE
jgi:hypothetical protein